MRITVKGCLQVEAGSRSLVPPNCPGNGVLATGGVHLPWGCGQLHVCRRTLASWVACAWPPGLARDRPPLFEWGLPALQSLLGSGLVVCPPSRDPLPLFPVWFGVHVPGAQGRRRKRQLPTVGSLFLLAGGPTKSAPYWGASAGLPNATAGAQISISGHGDFAQQQRGAYGSMWAFV